jgi:hypothetical protein
MTLGRTSSQQPLWEDLDRFCEHQLAADSIYAWLHRERAHLFPDEYFADLFVHHGRRSVPPSVVATVMVLQRLEGCSDREAVERYSFDARWRYAAGVGGYASGHGDGFVHTVLVDMRERLRRSARPDRVFEVTQETARAAGLVGRRRVLDSTPLYDAVTTMDTITLLRSAVRGVLRAADGTLAAMLRAALRSGDDYVSTAKPQIDWDDAEARAALIESRAQDAYACLALLADQPLDPELQEAMTLLATVTGQDLELDAEGHLRIARRVARDRVISTVDPEARHGHKTAAHSFDGSKGHIAIDADSEIITAAVVTAGNADDASVASTLIADLLPTVDAAAVTPPPHETEAAASAVIYGDQAYGNGAFQTLLADAGLQSRCKAHRPTAPGGRFSKDRFTIDLAGSRVTCPAGVTVPLRRQRDSQASARFGSACADCPLRADCTTAPRGRTVQVGPHEVALSRARTRQADLAWRDDYRSTRPRVERKLAHLMRRKHGGRSARMRGLLRVGGDFRWLAAVANLARLAVLGLHWRPIGGWAAA